MTTANVNVLRRFRENVVRGTFIGLTMDGARFENLFKQRWAQDFTVSHLTLTPLTVTQISKTKRLVTYMWQNIFDLNFNTQYGEPVREFVFVLYF